MSQFRLSDVHKSLVRHLVDTIDVVKAQNISPELDFHMWESRGDEDELPHKDLIGPSGWTFTEDRGLWTIHFGITISTVNDANLMREMEIADVIYDLWSENEVVPLRNSQGEQISELVVNEFELLVAGQSEKRNYRPIGLGLMRTNGS